MLDIEKEIKGTLGQKGMKVSELARLLDVTPQNMYNKFRRGSFSVDDLKKIADVLEMELVIKFE